MNLPAFDDIFAWAETLQSCAAPHHSVQTWHRERGDEAIERQFDTRNYKRIPGNPLVVVLFQRSPRTPSEDMILLSIPGLQTQHSSTHVTLTKGSWKKFHITSYYPGELMINNASRRMRPRSQHVPAGFQPILEGECASWYRVRNVINKGVALFGYRQPDVDPDEKWRQRLSADDNWTTWAVECLIESGRTGTFAAPGLGDHTWKQGCL